MRKFIAIFVKLPAQQKEIINFLGNLSKSNHLSLCMYSIGTIQNLCHIRLTFLNILFLNV